MGVCKFFDGAEHVDINDEIRSSLPEINGKNLTV